MEFMLEIVVWRRRNETIKMEIMFAMILEFPYGIYLIYKGVKNEK